MDHYLKGKETGIRDIPRVRFEVRERFFEGRIRFAEDFPIPGTDYQKLYLDPSKGALGRTRPESETRVQYSALKTTTESDKAEFLITFDKRTELVGYMKLRLWVSAIGADDMDLHVGIKKYDRHGNEVHLLDFNHFEQGMAAIGWLRVSHRELDEKRSTPWQPWLKHERLLKLKADEIVPVEIEILPSGTAFNKGDRLKLIVQGYDIIDFHYRYRHEETVNRGHHVIHGGGQYDSHLLVPVIPSEKN
jgi:predicted acyl esterase